MEDIIFNMLCDNVRMAIRPLVFAYPTTAEHPQYGNPNPDPPKPKPDPPEEEKE